MNGDSKWIAINDVDEESNFNLYEFNEFKWSFESNYHMQVVMHTKTDFQAKWASFQDKPVYNGSLTVLEILDSIRILWEDLSI